MDKIAIKEFLYGGLEELLGNSKYYYYSSSGSSYSHFTEEGKATVCELLELVAYKIRQAEDDSLDRRAKKMVMDNLKQ